MLRQLLLLTTLTGVLSAQGDVYLQRGDRVLFCGASKDQRRLDLTFLQTYVATRFPQNEIRIDYSDSDTFKNGSSGKTPSVLLALLPAYSSGDGKLQPSAASCLQTLVTAKATQPLTRIAAIVFDDSQPSESPGPNQVETIFHVGRDPFNGNSGPDQPDQAAGLASTLQLLRLWNAPATVNSVEIDVPTQSIAAENTTVRELAADRFVGWTQDERALPLPLAYVAESAPFNGSVQNIDSQRLRVTGLLGSKYALTIDGERIGILTKDELERGVNLALFPTPMTKQADRVLALTRDYMNSRSKDQEKFAEELRSTAKPQTHDYELQPLSEN